MFTQNQLTSLHRALAAEQVLTVYLDFPATDPALRQTWRTQLDHSLKDLRTWLQNASHDEREAFTQCAVHLDEALAPVVSRPPTAWCAFITTSGVHAAHALPTHVRTLTVWSLGPAISPYVELLRETDPVIVGVADSRKVDLYQYQAGNLTAIDKLHAHHVVEPPSHMGNPGSLGFHPGTHGVSGHDAAQRSLLAGRDRMLDEAAERIVALATNNAWVVIGGIPEVAARLAASLSPLGARVSTRIPLDVHASMPEIAAVARSAASTLRNARDNKSLTELDQMLGSGRATFGPTTTERAVHEQQVDTLYLTTSFIDTSVADVEEIVRAAVDQDAHLSLVGGDAARTLDEQGGIAARLRYRLDKLAS